LGVRFYFESVTQDGEWFHALQSIILPYKKMIPGTNNLLIIGGGDAGEKIYREIRDNARLRYHVVGFLDDDSLKHGKKIHGIPVLGYINDIKVKSKRTKP